MVKTQLGVIWVILKLVYWPQYWPSNSSLVASSTNVESGPWFADISTSEIIGIHHYCWWQFNLIIFLLSFLWYIDSSFLNLNFWLTINAEQFKLIQLKLGLPIDVWLIARLPAVLALGMLMFFTWLSTINISLLKCMSGEGTADLFCVFWRTFIRNFLGLITSNLF